jgi:hypothetical protein
MMLCEDREFTIQVFEFFFQFLMVLKKSLKVNMGSSRVTLRVCSSSTS